MQPIPRSPILLDGSIGALLAEAGVPTSGAAWTAHANLTHSAQVAELHAEYAAAGATVHTANTFRARPRDAGDAWRDLLTAGVAACRAGVPSRRHTVLGSLGPYDDCYAPSTSAAATRRDHRQVARALAAAGVDGILCETFANPDEAWVATEEAAATGRTVWTSLCPGIDGDLLTPEQVRRAAVGAIDRGASCVLVNCVDAVRAGAYAEALSALPFGVYANAGDRRTGTGWGRADGPKRYTAVAADWLAQGAMVVGGCCGTTPEHIAYLARYLGIPESL